MMTFKNINGLLAELDRLTKAYELLQSVHLEIGPYGRGRLEDKTRWAINDLFGFDDSE